MKGGWQSGTASYSKKLLKRLRGEQSRLGRSASRGISLQDRKKKEASWVSAMEMGDEWQEMVPKLTEEEYLKLMENYMGILKQETGHWTVRRATDMGSDIDNKRISLGPIRMSADYDYDLGDVIVSVKKEANVIGGHDPTIVCRMPEEAIVSAGEEAVNAYFERNPNGTLHDAVRVAYVEMINRQRVVWNSNQGKFFQRIVR